MSKKPAVELEIKIKKQMAQALRNLPKKARDFWVSEGVRIRFYRRAADWMRRGIPEIRKYASGFPDALAFVMGSGPSLARVKEPEWAKLESYFSVGMNRTPFWLQKERKIFTLPKLCYVTDRIARTDYWRDEYVEPMQKCKGKILVTEIADNIPHDWTCTSYGLPPIWDMDMGLSICAQFNKHLWLRSTIACIHLCGLLGFRKVCLLGADHGPDYFKDEPAKANVGLSAMVDFLAQKDIELINCGMESSVDSIPYVPLKEVLRGQS